MQSLVLLLVSPFSIYMKLNLLIERIGKEFLAKCQKILIQFV